MPFCNKCGTEVPENTNFCPKCGGQQGGGGIVDTGEKAAKINNIIIAVASVIGILAVFLPWITTPLKSMNLLNLGDLGIMTLMGLFFFSALSLIGAGKVKETAKNKMLKYSIMYAMSGFFGAIRIYIILKVQHNFEGEMCLLCSWGIGLYLSYLSGATALVMSILMIIDKIKRGKK